MKQPAGLMVMTALTLGAATLAQQNDVWRIGTFEETAPWEGLARTTEQANTGRYSGKWDNLPDQTSIRAPGFPADISRYDRLVFSLYSTTANGQRLTLVLNSENRDVEGWDYYFYHFRVDWEGWKTFDLGLGTDIVGTRKPLGFDQIDYLSINASGWQNVPLESTVLYLDDVAFVRDTVRLEAEQGPTRVQPDNVLASVWTLTVTNRGAEARQIPLTRTTAPDQDRQVSLEGLPASTPRLLPGASTTLEVVLSTPIGDAAPLTRYAVRVEATPANTLAPAPSRILSAVVPLPERDHPFLFGDADLFRRAKARTEHLPWAKERLDAIVSTAEGYLTTPLDIPDMPGQWSHHYVCKQCGYRLSHDPPKHVCRHCGAEYSGWPYDQVIASGKHGTNFRRTKELALAYALTGREAFAERARDILLGYADRYPEWPLHNVWGKLSNSAARVYAQTLDEGVAAIGLAWAYDLIYASPALSENQRQRIETRFLREMVKTIRRNNSGISNWQSWHNAGVAAIGFCLEDAEMVSHALQGPSGFEFQLRESILEDGFWYEGTAAYHYYALNALRWTAEAAGFAGIDYWDHPAYRSLFDAPLLYTFPNLTFPAVNDSDVFSITGQHSLYDLAYARTADPTYLHVATFGRRESLEAFLYGVDDLPPPPARALASKVFDGIGAAVLRQGRADDQLYLHLDYGPHGGGHGHQDKLALILFALGKQLAPDPGRLAYGAPLQGSWYKQTIAHNTVCVDGTSQRAAEGTLLAFEDNPHGAFMQAECDTAYDGVMLKRTLVVADGLVVDVYTVKSDEEHTYDWAYHNIGDLTTSLDLEPQRGPLGEKAGYQHVTDVRKAVTDGTWQARFRLPDGVVSVTMAGHESTLVAAGSGLLGNPPAPCPMLVARRRTKATHFVTVIEPTRTEPRVTAVRLLQRERQDEVAVEIDMAGERLGILIADEPGVTRKLHGMQTNGRVLLVRQPK